MISDLIREDHKNRMSFTYDSHKLTFKEKKKQKKRMKKTREEKKRTFFVFLCFIFFWNFFDLKSLSHIFFKINEKKTQKK